MSLTAVAFLVLFFSCCLVGLSRPGVALTAYMVAFYLHPPSRWWGADLPDLRWSLIAGLVTIASVLMASRGSGADRNAEMDKGLFTGFVLMMLYLAVQLGWVLDFDLHVDFIVLYLKYFLAIWFVHRICSTPDGLKLFLALNTVGCGYLGWIAYERDVGGRVEGFGGPGIDDANSAAMHMVFGLFCAAGLFLMRETWLRALALLAVPFILNGVILTQSRGAFVALAVGGLAFLAFAPTLLRGTVRIYAALGVVVFLMLSPAVFWERISSLLLIGEEVQGVNTGDDRLDIASAQWEMFLDHPLGTGHRGTALLSPYYMDATLLTNYRGSFIRASHNTYMTVLVDMGIFGIALMFMYGKWVSSRLLGLRSAVRSADQQLLPRSVVVGVPVAAAMLGSLAVGDLATSFLKMESRVWALAFVMSLASCMVVQRAEQQAQGQAVY